MTLQIALAIAIFVVVVYAPVRAAMTRRFAKASTDMLKNAVALLDDKTFPDELRAVVEVTSIAAHTKTFLMVLIFGPFISRSKPPKNSKLVVAIDSLSSEQRDRFFAFADASFRVALFARVWGFYLSIPGAIWRQATRFQIKPQPEKTIRRYYDRHNSSSDHVAA